ncbi:MAG: 5-formyltetrahydrofolate cyclo-ligase [Phycisphaerales bacterium]|nr:5-formyltetrahydrofolate cyclo-ligase [Phycisphaerales bacterium]
MVSPTVGIAKRELRARAREAMAALPAVRRAEASRAACGLVQQQEWFRRAMAMMVYAPLPMELDIRPLVESALRAGRVVCMPRVGWEGRSLTPVAIQSLDDLVDGERFGLKEPRPGARVVAKDMLDLVIVPGLAFDAGGGRLGRGAGFYDRFLGSLGPRAVKVGVAYEAQVFPSVPTELQDVRLDVVVTESRIVTVKG